MSSIDSGELHIMLRQGDSGAWQTLVGMGGKKDMAKPTASKISM